MIVQIRDETPADVALLHALHRSAFGGEEESRLVDALRSQQLARVSLVAEADDQLAGHLLLSEIEIVDGLRRWPVLSLAPMAVLPAFQRRGIGSRLVAASIARAREQRSPAIFVLGHPEFYRRFGFSAALAARFECVYACEAFMAIELAPGALDKTRGRLEYSTPFHALA